MTERQPESCPCAGRCGDSVGVEELLTGPGLPQPPGKQTDIDGAVREQQATDGRQVLRVVAETGLRALGEEAGWLALGF